MKKNLMLSGFSLLCTLFLFICIITAWYVTNKEASATGIMGSTEGDHYTLKLQRGTYNEATTKWTWEDTEHLSFTNISPKNSFYFRIALDIEDTSENISLSANFADISSTIIEDRLVISDGYVCVKEGTTSYPLYELVDNKVTIKEVINEITTDKVLYQNVNNKVLLDDYLIEDTFKFYNFGLTEPTNNVLPVEDPSTNEIEDNSVVLSQLDPFNIQVTEENIITENGKNKAYFYFALEFNEDLSIVTQEGQEGNSNCYMYQKLSIGHIQITHNN
ncbi:MAG: hypothetical protein IJA65_05730 [Acholeplasmatales bacterium]|nr:hypothetical protein [Acholeplasmatales bacterium]